MTVKIAEMMKLSGLRNGHLRVGKINARNESNIVKHAGGDDSKRCFKMINSIGLPEISSLPLEGVHRMILFEDRLWSMYRCRGL